MATPSQWVHGARPRTLPAAIAEAAQRSKDGGAVVALTEIPGLA